MALSADLLQEYSLWVSLSQISGLGSQTFCRLLHAFGSPDQIYTTSFNQLREIVAEPIALAIKSGPDPESAQATLAWLDQENNHSIAL